MGQTDLSFAENSKERLLCTKECPELGTRRPYAGENEGKCQCFRLVGEKINDLMNNIRETAAKAYQMGRSDPRKVIFAAKMGLSLAIVSVLILFKEPLKTMSQYSIWAILTVVVVFEFSIGATLNKGFNRALGTFSAGALSIVIGELSLLAGELEELFIVLSIFIAGFCASYAKLYPSMKQYEYGFRVFLLTYCIVLVSGSSQFLLTAGSRLLLIAIGAGVCLVVNICIYPIWAGEDLHKLVVRNFKGVATSLEGCVNAYVQCVEYERVPSKILTYQASDDPVYKGYRSVVESTSQESSLLDFAIWEPPHGRYKMSNYPWKNYVIVSGALRHCAFMVMAMHGCILSEIQAPAELRRVFSRYLQRVGAEGAKVLRELGDKIEMMEKLSPGDLLAGAHEAAEELQMMIDKKSYLLIKTDSWETEEHSRIFQEPGNFSCSLGNKSKQSLSETVLDIRSVTMSRVRDPENPDMSASPSPPRWSSSEDVFKKQMSWPSRISLQGDKLLNLREVTTSGSASALSFATFASLLIEFVARLQNLVDSFEELSGMARFQESNEFQSAVKERKRCWSTLIRLLDFSK